MKFLFYTPAQFGNNINWPGKCVQEVKGYKQSDSMPFQSPININVSRHIFIIQVSKRPSRSHCHGPPLQCNSIRMGRWKSQSRRVVGEMVEIKSVGQRCPPVLPALAPTSFHLCGCADPLRMAFHYSSTDNNRRFNFGAISDRWPQSYYSVPASFSH